MERREPEERAGLEELVPREVVDVDRAHEGDEDRLRGREGAVAVEGDWTQVPLLTSVVMAVTSQ